MDAFETAVHDLAVRCAADPAFAAEVEAEREQLRRSLKQPGMTVGASRFSPFVLLGVRPRQGHAATGGDA